MKKILELLEDLKHSINHRYCTDSVIVKIKQAIKELEDLENISCESCKYHLSDKGNYPLGCSECSLFYANKWESK